MQAGGGGVSAAAACLGGADGRSADYGSASGGAEGLLEAVLWEVLVDDFWLPGFL